MFQMGKKISHRFFVACMLIAVLPIGLMGFQTHMLAKRALTESAFAHVATIAEDHAKHLDAWLRERLNDIGVLSRLPAIQEATWEYCCAIDSGAPPEKLTALLKDTLVTTQERSSSYDGIFITLPGGKVLASTHPMSEDFASSQQEEIVQRLLESEDPAVGALCSGADSMWHMQMGARIRAPDGSTHAFIIAVLDVSKTIDPVMNDRIGLGETGEIYLVNKEGKIISESRFLSRSETAKSPFDTVGIRSVLDRKQGTAVYTNYVGREVLGSYLWLPRYEWGILTEMGMDEILWPLRWIKMVAILTSLLVSAVCFLMAYAVSRRIAGPIGEIADAARRMTEGELEQRIVFTSRDEVGMLARSFNTMAQQVSRLIQSLHQKEDSLQKAYDELVATQDQLVQSERMAAIGELVACVAHEMRNPLSSVKLNLQILEMDLDRDEVLSEHCQIALDQVAQLERMFSDLLNYSKPLVLEKDDVGPRDLVNRSLEQLDGEITAGDIRIVSREDPDVSSHLMADADKIVQVLVNVLKNAMEASPPGGQVEIATHVDKTARESMIEISVTDQGPGIPARNLQFIFQPFFTTKKKGTGLGLCIVKKIMDAHHGVVSISSEEGKGTTVRLALPLARGAV